jgi:hypothetical protein
MRTRDVRAILACGTAYRKSSPSPRVVFYFHVQFVIISFFIFAVTQLFDAVRYKLEGRGFDSL